jgi:hypothetical protein
MRFARISLRLAALGFAGFGVALLVRPTLLGVVDVALPTPAALTEIRAFYGGLELGLAAFFLLASTRDAWIRPALFAQVAALGGVVLARAVGVIVDGSAEPPVLLFGAVEASGAVLGLLALRRLRS